VASVDQLTYEEFLRSIPTPTLLSIIDMDPLKGNAVLEIDPSISYCMIDRLFGGTGEGAKVHRELSDIEQSVMEGIIVRLLSNMREAWTQVIDLRPRLSSIETNPQFAQIVPPSEMVVLVTLETKVGDEEGMMNLCIPYVTIEPIIGKLSSSFWFSSVRQNAPSQFSGILKQKLSNVEMDLVAEIGTINVPIRDVLALRVGDTVRLSTVRYDDPLVLNVGNQRKFLCQPGVVGKKRAVQIIGRCENEADKKIDPLEMEGDETYE
jgi:flagellar motor switch protein FliM